MGLKEMKKLEKELNVAFSNLMSEDEKKRGISYLQVQMFKKKAFEKKVWLVVDALSKGCIDRDYLGKLTKDCYKQLQSNKKDKVFWC